MIKRKTIWSLSSRGLIFVSVLVATLFLVQGEALASKRKAPAKINVRLGAIVNKLPAGYRVVRVSGAKFYYHGGFFYRHGPSGYVVVKAPLGAVISTLPVGFTRVVVSGMEYYFYGGVYYRSIPSGYIVIKEPVETIAVQVPSQNLNTSPGASQPQAIVSSKVLVTAQSLNVRSGPGTNHPVIRQTYKENILVIHGNAPGWLYVELPNGQFGWVMSKFTVQTPLNRH